MWNEAFRKLGKFDIDEKNFDKEEYIKMKQEVERWEREKRDRMEENWMERSRCKR